MMFGAVLAGSLLGLGQFCAAQVVDVAIIGGGLSGLTAARDLIAAGKSVIVLEARGRTGGRVLNVVLANGGVTEAGAEFVGPTQDRVLALAKDLGLKLYNTYDNGSHILYEDNTILLYEPGGPNGAAPPIVDASLLEVGTAQFLLDEMAATIDVNAPWDNPNAAVWDGMTLGSWYNQVAPSVPARFILDVATTSIFSADATELSMLYALSYIASAGNATTPGTLERLTSTAGGSQESRVVGGTQLLATKLAARFSSSIRLNAPVRKIQKIGSKYIIWADTAVIIATKVIVAMSPPMAGRIQYDPILPASRDQLNARMHMGALGKAIAIYKTPFWRAANLSGQVVSDSGIIRSTYDNSPPDGSYGASMCFHAPSLCTSQVFLLPNIYRSMLTEPVMGFIEANEMRAYDALPEAAVKAAYLAQLVKYFGPKANEATQVVLQRWDNEEWSRGAPVAFAPPMVLTQYGKALRAPVDGIHWAGTETSDYWVGYMDGAIRSGERVAKEVIAVL